VSWISDNLIEVSGYSAQIAIGTDWWQTNIHPEDRERVTEQTTNDLFKRGRSVQEFRFRHGDGTYQWIKSDMRLIRDETGQPSEVVGAWSDITELKRAEEQRLELREQLEQAHKLEGIGRLAGGVAHDFNNLLGVIIGSAEMLQSDLPEDPALRGYTGDILNAALRGAELTRQLLAFSRQQVFQPTVLSLSDLVRDFERMLRRIIPINIEIGTALKSIGQIRADAGQIEQVIMNLAVNARDAMTTGGRLTIKTADVELDESCAKQLAEVKPGPYALLAVIDSGHGMTPELMGRMFEPFFTTKDRGKGTGLGLGTVHGIVKQSGGTISVYSEPGRGTTFKVYLPRLVEPVEIATSRFSPGEMPRGTETILVVEDEANLRSIASEILKDLGYSVQVAENGEDAIRVSAAHDGPIHLLVTDVIMPGMGGRDLADCLLKSRPDLKVLYISGYTDDSVIAQGVFSSQVAFLQKPIASADLAQKVRAVLDAEQLPASRSEIT
jgi:PAS domain S-box-containing protein